MKGFIALLSRSSIIGGYQIGENLNTGHHGQDTDISSDGEVQISGRKSLKGKNWQVKASPDQSRQDHQPEQD